MKRAAPVILAAIALTPATTLAAPLSMARGRAAIARYEVRYNGTVAHCWRDHRDRRAVYCGVIENITVGPWAGWQWRAADAAVPHGATTRVRPVV